MKRVLAAVIAVFLVWLFWPEKEHEGATPMPKQTETQARPFVYHGYKIKPLADYEIDAVVLSTKRYKHPLSKVDLVLAWSKLADKKVYGKVKISQSDRWFFYHYPSELGYSLRYLMANVHTVPASSRIEKELESLRRGDEVEMKGWLIEAKKGRTVWRSSLSRKDQGYGACELFYVKELLRK